MLTCLCDAFYGEVGIATVQVLEHAGCRVRFPGDQTCCGQPPFNAGDWPAARRMAEHLHRVFERGVPIVTPSTSCAAMLREGYGLLGVPAPGQIFDLSEFLLNEIAVERWPQEPTQAAERSPVAFHRACHARALHLGDLQERLLSMVPGLRLVPFAQSDQCCGFGGAFSVNHPTISVGIGREKLENLCAAGVTEVVSGDMGCLMHLGGIIEREGLPLRTRHYVQLLAEAIPE